MTRRQLLGPGLGGTAVAAAGGIGIGIGIELVARGIELVARGVLPGKGILDQVAGTCTVAAPHWPVLPGQRITGTGVPHQSPGHCGLGAGGSVSRYHR